MNRIAFSALSLFLCGWTAYANISFMAEGVNTSDLTASERFYDSGKGYYWSDYYTEPGLSLLRQAVKDDSFQSLGDLVDYMPEKYQGELNAGGSPGLFLSEYTPAVAPLTKDTSLCWAHATANVLQYWQSYYGMFAKCTGKLTDGLTYSKQYVSQYAGTQSLKIGMLFYDNWKNEGGFMQFGALWYLKGKDAISEAECAKRLNADSANGGYFANWFTEGDTTSYQTTEGYIGLSDIGRAFAEGMGYEQINGEWVQTVKGQIGSLTVSIDGIGDHAITCYGFELDEMNNLKSITYANSDDSTYALHTRTVSYDSSGRFVLSADNDEDNTNGNTWTLYSYEFIRTPDSLVKLREAYDNSLTWNGNGWKNTSDGTSQQYTDGKSLVFDDSASISAEGNTVKAQVSDQVNAKLLVIDNSEKDYEISTVSSGSISVSDILLKMGSGNATVSGVDVAKLNIQGGNLILTGKADVTALTELIIADGASLSVSINNSLAENDEGTIALGSDSIARFGIGAALNANLVLNGTELTLANGGLLLGSSLTLCGNNILNADLDETTVLMTGVDSLFLGDRQVFDLSAGTIDASAYFTNLEEGSYSICYHGTTLSLQQIPEPTSVATFLLASALLFARRHRKN